MTNIFRDYVERKIGSIKTPKDYTCVLCSIFTSNCVYYNVVLLHVGLKEGSAGQSVGTRSAWPAPVKIGAIVSGMLIKGS